MAMIYDLTVTMGEDRTGMDVLARSSRREPQTMPTDQHRARLVTVVQRVLQMLAVKMVMSACTWTETLRTTEGARRNGEA